MKLFIKVNCSNIGRIENYQILEMYSKKYINHYCGYECKTFDKLGMGNQIKFYYDVDTKIYNYGDLILNEVLKMIKYEFKFSSIVKYHQCQKQNKILQKQ